MVENIITLLLFFKYFLLSLPVMDSLYISTKQGKKGKFNNKNSAKKIMI